jgi:copper chaperone
MSQTLSLTVTGMKCGGCETTIKTALQNLDGVVSAQASFKENKVEVEFEPARTDADAIKQTIVGAGFTVE